MVNEPIPAKTRFLAISLANALTVMRRTFADLSLEVATRIEVSVMP
jgi:hypothetical protein